MVDLNGAGDHIETAFYTFSRPELHKLIHFSCHNLIALLTQLVRQRTVTIWHTVTRLDILGLDAGIQCAVSRDYWLIALFALWALFNMIHHFRFNFSLLVAE